MQRLHTADGELRLAHWAEGKRISDSVLSEMREYIESGSASGPLLSTALLFKSIGEAGSGYYETAAWDFGAAQALNMDLVDVDLAAYGEPGHFLDTHRYQRSPTPGPIQLPAQKASDPGITPPTKLGGERLSYPYAQKAACNQALVLIQVVIDKAGRPTVPYLLKPTEPVLGLAAIQSLVTWRFAPATLDGQPIPVTWVLLVTFQCA